MFYLEAQSIQKLGDCEWVGMVANNDYENQITLLICSFAPICLHSVVNGCQTRPPTWGPKSEYWGVGAKKSRTALVVRDWEGGGGCGGGESAQQAVGRRGRFVGRVEGGGQWGSHVVKGISERFRNGTK